MFRASRLIALAVVICCQLSACSNSPQGPKLVAVKGKVLYKGAPLANASVSFQPEKGPAAVGRTNEAGEFTLITTGKPGAVEGTYKISVKAVEGGTSVEDVSFDSPEYDKIMRGELPKEKWLIPEKFGNTFTSGLTETVTAGKANNLTIDLGS